MLLVILAASWKHICYDYIFLVAALLADPALRCSKRRPSTAPGRSGASSRSRLPLIAPTIFFLS